MSRLRGRRLNVYRWLAVVLFIAPSAALAAADPGFAIRNVSARGAVEVDSGVALEGARVVRLSASGTLQSLELRNVCPRIEPAGCAAASVGGATIPTAPAGALLAKFIGARGQDVGSWRVAGPLALFPVPLGAQRLVYRINAAATIAAGSFRVVTDAVGADPPTPARGSRAPSLVARRAPGSSAAPALASLFLRRFGFAATPAEAASVEREGIVRWLDSQLRPDSIDDSAALASLVPDPRYIQYQGSFNYDPFPYEAQLPQREYASKRQVLEKVTLHWLEHFSVGRSKGKAAYVARYLATLRRDALGNFTQLLIDVAREPAMLVWLDNNENTATATASANENFARELLQLYMMGTTKLNDDGSEALDARGQPEPNYSQSDVTALATALTGYKIEDVPVLGSDPLDDVGVLFLKALHAKGPYRMFGGVLGDPGDDSVLDAAIRYVVRKSDSIAPFQAKEMLQRFVTEAPSPGYIERIAHVWQSNVDAPDQIARVVRAIALDPEFAQGRGRMVKEPIEYVLDAYRSLPVKRVPQTGPMDYSMHNLVVVEMPALEQDLFSPDSVFSFYRPGDKEALLTDSELLSRWQFAARFARSGDPSFELDRAALSTLTHGLAPVSTAAYLCDALIDGGTPGIQALLANYLSGAGADLDAAVWLLLISPEYEVN